MDLENKSIRFLVLIIFTGSQNSHLHVVRTAISMWSEWPSPCGQNGHLHVVRTAISTWSERPSPRGQNGHLHVVRTAISTWSERPSPRGQNGHLHVVRTAISTWSERPSPRGQNGHLHVVRTATCAVNSPVLIRIIFFQHFIIHLVRESAYKAKVLKRVAVLNHLNVAVLNHSWSMARMSLFIWCMIREGRKQNNACLGARGLC